MKKRKSFLDIAKGLLIIAVVFAHIKGINPFIMMILYWFHMPAFFMIGGYLFKPPHDKGVRYKDWFKKLSLKYFIPYISYYFLVTIIIQRKFSLKYMIASLYGGRAVSGVFWFIPCMFLTIVVFALLELKLRKSYVILIILILYLIGHFESIFYLPHNGNYLSWEMIYKFPLDGDVCLVSLAYFAIGYYFKNIFDNIVTKINLLSFIIVTLVCGIVIILNLKGLMNFSIDMKLSNYKHILLDLIIPILFSIWVIEMSQLISMSFIRSPMEYIGKNTLPIMYLHIAIIDIAYSRLTHNIYILILIAISCSLLFSFIYPKIRLLRIVFSGNITNLKKEKGSECPEKM